METNLQLSELTAELYSVVKCKRCICQIYDYEIKIYPNYVTYIKLLEYIRWFSKSYITVYLNIL